MNSLLNLKDIGNKNIYINNWIMSLHEILYMVLVNQGEA